MAPFVRTKQSIYAESIIKKKPPARTWTSSDAHRSFSKNGCLAKADRRKREHRLRCRYLRATRQRYPRIWGVNTPNASRLGSPQPLHRRTTCTSKERLRATHTCEMSVEPNSMYSVGLAPPCIATNCSWGMLCNPPPKKYSLP